MVAEAVEELRTRHAITTDPVRTGRASLHWVKEEPLGSPSTTAPEPPARASRAPLARRPGYLAPELSVVVVVYNMRREAMRTLQSLSRQYQRDIDDVRYEVIVVENGSDPDQRLGRTSSSASARRSGTSTSAKRRRRHRSPPSTAASPRPRAARWR